MLAWHCLKCYEMPKISSILGFLNYFKRQWLDSLADIINFPSTYNFLTKNALEGGD